jgi:hypothetical protein
LAGLVKHSIQDLLIMTVQKNDRSDQKRSGKGLETSDPNSLPAITKLRFGDSSWQRPPLPQTAPPKLVI